MQSAASQASSAVSGARPPQLRPALAPPAGTPDTPFSAIMDGATANDPPSEPPPAPRQDAPPAPTATAAPPAPAAPAAAHSAPVKAAQNSDKTSDDQTNPAGTPASATASTLKATSADQDTLTTDAKAALKAKTTAAAGDDGSANTSGADPKPKADAGNDAAPVATVVAVPAAPAPAATPIIAPFIAPAAAATPQAAAPASSDAETAIAAITAAAGGPAAMGASGGNGAADASGLTGTTGPAGPVTTPAASPAAKAGAFPAGVVGGLSAPADPTQIATGPAAKSAQPATTDAAKLAGPVPSATDATAAPSPTEVHAPAHGKDLASEDKSSAMRALGTDTLQIDKAPAPPGDPQVQAAAPAGDQSQAGVLQSLGAPATTTAASPMAAPPALAAAAAAAVPLAGVAIEIAAHAHAGSNRFDIRLDPPDLGRIDVRLDVDRQGNVTSHLVVERSATLDLLRRDAPQLERALQDAGLKTAGDALQFSLSDQGAGAQNRSFQDSSAARLARVILPNQDIPPVDTVRSYGRLLGPNGGVDIRV